MAYIPPPNTLPPGSIVDAYVRDSGGPRQDASTDQQIGELVTFCRIYGLELRKTYADVAKSGSSTASRDEFNNLIDATRREEDRPKGILLWNYARFSRDLDDAVYYKALIRNRSVVVHSITDPIPEGQYGRIVEFFIDISNAEKRRQTASDAKRGLRDLVEKYHCVPGKPPTGFMRELVKIGTHRDGSPRNAHRWLPNPELVPTIQRAFQMRAAGATLAQIQEATHLFGSNNSYKTFFNNKIYVGILEFGSDLVIENYCEPIIDPSTWAAVQQRVADYALDKLDREHPRRVHTPYVLSGLCYCQTCGSSLSGNSVTYQTRSKAEGYRCTRAKRRAGCDQKRIGRAALEDAVLHTISRYIINEDNLMGILEVERTMSGQHETRRLEKIEMLKKERKKITQQITNITNTIAASGLRSISLVQKLTELESDSTTIKNEIHQLETTTYTLPAEVSDMDLINIAKEIQDILAFGSPEEIKQILLNFIHRVTVKKEIGQVVGSIAYYLPLHLNSLPIPRIPSGPLVFLPPIKFQLYSPFTIITSLRIETT